MKYTKKDCINALRQAAEELGEPLGKKEYKKSDYSPSATTISKRFGGWNDAKEVAGLETVGFIQRGDTLPDNWRTSPEPEYTDQDCIQALRDAADELGKPLGTQDYRDSDYTPRTRTIIDRFGSWNEAKEAAGLDIIKRGKNSSRGRYNRTGSLFHTDDRGYESWQVHDWPSCRRVLVHRLVAISEHGADAVADKVVHHKNGIPWDNRPENLELLDRGEHTRLHIEAGDIDFGRGGRSV